MTKEFIKPTELPDIETIEERMEHLVLLRQVQSEKPENAKSSVACNRPNCAVINAA